MGINKTKKILFIKLNLWSVNAKRIKSRNEKIILFRLK